MPYCKRCGTETQTGKMCEKCTAERVKEYQKRYYEKKSKIKRTNLPIWEFRLGLKKKQIEKLSKEIEKISQRIKEFKDYENQKSK